LRGSRQKVCCHGQVRRLVISAKLTGIPADPVPSFLMAGGFGCLFPPFSAAALRLLFSPSRRPTSAACFSSFAFFPTISGSRSSPEVLPFFSLGTGLRHPAAGPANRGNQPTFLAHVLLRILFRLLPEDFCFFPFFSTFCCLSNRLAGFTPLAVLNWLLDVGFRPPRSFFLFLGALSYPSSLSFEDAQLLYLATPRAYDSFSPPPFMPFDSGMNASPWFTSRRPHRALASSPSFA